MERTAVSNNRRLAVGAKRLLCTLAIALGIAAAVQAQFSAQSSLVAIAHALFITNARDVGPAHIYDKLSPNGEIARVAYSPNGTTETHSIYAIDTRRNCIAVLREETWNRPP